MRIDVARGVAAAAAAAGVLVVVVVARSSPTRPFVDHSRVAPTDAIRTFIPPSLSQSIASGSPLPGGRPAQAPSGLHAVILALTLLIVVAVLAYGLRFRPRLGRRALARAGVSVGSVDEPGDPPPVEVSAGIESGLVALERGPASEAIIACWLRVEAAAEAAGAAPRPSETAAEFVDRVLTGYGVREEPLRTLAALYREARFSAHPIDEDGRRSARDCLDAIRNDLAGTRAAG